jgi:nitroimidazol reductase NimA-like FMN-containing flavoprotein (pyridoxamine 5'-phosphate oxidase superfamily)
MSKAVAPSSRTRVRRLPARAHYDATSIAAIIDSAWLCTIAFQWDGSVHAMPTSHWREGDHLYIHGARASRMLKALQAGEACVTVAHVDGLVFARSAFHHSMNYRSVVVYGRFEAVEDPRHKDAALRALIDKLAPGRWDGLRPISDKERNATTVLRIALSEASAKVRNWGVKDDDEDMGWPVWAGVVPLSVVAGAPETDPLSREAEVPANVCCGSGL